MYRLWLGAPMTRRLKVHFVIDERGDILRKEQNIDAVFDFLRRAGQEEVEFQTEKYHGTIRFTRKPT